MTRNTELVETTRARFRPDEIMTLFIGESAPDSDLGRVRPRNYG